ncbi:hypothetical protein ACQ86N_38145 [Puia sp. P3]|uniref:hypothetical protein n=1 Tax=Puia sp. P3 TaxID=3423952 RepID=UPI003D67329F
MKKLYLLVVLAGIAGVTRGQSPSATSQLRSTTGQTPSTTTQVPDDTSAARLVRAFRFVDSALSHPTLTYDVTGPDIPQEIKDILTRFDSAVTANKKWFDGYRNKFTSTNQSTSASQPLPYNERFGITPEEYTRLQQLEKQPPHLVTLAQTTITTTRDKNVLHFKGDGESQDPGLSRSRPPATTDHFCRRHPPVHRPHDHHSQLASFQLTRGYSWKFRKVDVNNSLQSYKITARVSEAGSGHTHRRRPNISSHYLSGREGRSKSGQPRPDRIHSLTRRPASATRRRTRGRTPTPGLPPLIINPKLHYRRLPPNPLHHNPHPISPNPVKPVDLHPPLLFPIKQHLPLTMRPVLGSL